MQGLGIRDEDLELKAQGLGMIGLGFIRVRISG